MVLRRVNHSQDLFRQNVCPVCSAERLTGVFPIDTEFAGQISGMDLSGLYVGVAHCEGCGHQFIWPVPQPAFLKAFYATYMSVAKDGFYRDRSRREIPDSFRKYYGQWLERLRAAGGQGSLLDIGSGLGMFLRLAREYGFEVAGVEPNREAADALEKRYGIPVHRCLLEELDTPAEYNVVSMWDLLEHVPDPRKAMLKAHEVLRPGGWLVLETPVRDSIIHWLAKGLYRISAGRIRRPLFRVYGIHHLQYFSEESIRWFLADNGFKVIEARRDETNVHALLKQPESGSRMKTEAYNAAMRGAFLLARLLRKQNKLIVLARRIDVEGGVVQGGKEL